MAWKLPQTIDELDRLIDDAIAMEGSEYLATIQGFPDEQLQNLFRRLTTAVKTYGKPPRFYQQRRISMYRVGMKLFRSKQEAQRYANQRVNGIVTANGTELHTVPILKPRQQGVELAIRRPDEPEDERALALED